MSFNAGNAFITISPDMSSFNDEVKAEFAKNGDDAGKAFGDAFQDRVKVAFADLPNAEIKADVDTTEASAQLDELARPRTATIKVSTDKSSLDQAKTAIAGIQESAGKLVPSVTSAAAFTSVALGPQALGAALGAAGIGVALGAAAADAGAFGAIAVPMFTSVTAAQKKLTTAQQEYAKATTSAQVTKALADEKAALAGLTPAEKDLLTELTALEGAWKKLSQAEQPVVGAAIAPWLATATSGMQFLVPLIEDGAGAIGLLGTEAKTALQDPFWGTFFNTLGTTGQIALVNFGEAAGHVGDGLAHLFVTFAPDIDNLLPLVDKAATAFDNWSKTVTSGGLEDFFSKTFSHANLQALKGDLTDVGSFFQNVASATSTLSPAAFGGLNGVLTAIGLLPPDAILALTGLFLATKTIGAIGNLAGLANNVIGLGKAALGALGLGAETAEAATEGTAVGTAAGSAAATAFTGAFSTELNLALPTAFVSVGTSLATAADAAGTVWGTAAATTFGTAFAAEDALGVTAALTAVGAEGAAEAGVAGAALGAAAAAGFGTGVAGVAAELGTAVGTAGLVAVLSAGAAGLALGTAVGVGFGLGLGATSVTTAVGKISSDVQAAAAAANTWLQPAGQQTGLGFVNGLNSEQAAASQAAGQLKNSVASGTAGSNAWLTAPGTQTGSGFNAGLASTRAEVNSTAASMKTWVTDNFQPAGAWLTNAGISVVQGFANGIISASSIVISAAESIANSVTNIISSALKINSPSKVMMPIGSSVPEGMAVGMLGGVGFINDAGTTLANATVASLSGLATAQSLSALGVPSIGSPARLPGVSSPLSGGGLQLMVTPTMTGNALMDEFTKGLRFDIQATTGGDVQAHLGQGTVRTS